MKTLKFNGAADLKHLAAYRAIDVDDGKKPWSRGDTRGLEDKVAARILRDFPNDFEDLSPEATKAKGKQAAADPSAEKSEK